MFVILFEGAIIAEIMLRLPFPIPFISHVLGILMLLSKDEGTSTK